MALAEALLIVIPAQPVVLGLKAVHPVLSTAVLALKMAAVVADVDISTTVGTALMRSCHCQLIPSAPAVEAAIAVGAVIF